MNARQVGFDKLNENKWIVTYALALVTVNIVNLILVLQLFLIPKRIN